MIQDRYQIAVPAGVPGPQQSQLLRRHPVAIPLLLLSGSLGMGIVSIFPDRFILVLNWLAEPLALLCLSLAIILGISGILASIIAILESVDRRNQIRMLPQAKEHSI